MSSLIDQIEDRLTEGDESAGADLAWRALSMAAGVLAAVGARKLVALLWRQWGPDRPPDPTSRETDWVTALQWAVASGIGAGVARTIGQRAAKGVWERATGSAPPGADGHRKKRSA